MYFRITLGTAFIALCLGCGTPPASQESSAPSWNQKQWVAENSKELQGRLETLAALAELVENPVLPKESTLPAAVSIMVTSTSEPNDSWWQSLERSTPTTSGAPVPGAVVLSADLLEFAGRPPQKSLYVPGIGYGIPSGLMTDFSKLRDWLNHPEEPRDENKVLRQTKLLENLAYLVVVEPLRYSRPKLASDAGSDREFTSGEIEMKVLLIDVKNKQIVGGYRSLVSNSDKLEISTQVSKQAYGFEKQAAVDKTANDKLESDLKENVLGSIFSGSDHLLKGGFLLGGPTGSSGTAYRVLPFESGTSTTDSTDSKERAIDTKGPETDSKGPPTDSKDSPDFDKSK